MAIDRNNYIALGRQLDDADKAEQNLYALITTKDEEITKLKADIEALRNPPVVVDPLWQVRWEDNFAAIDTSKWRYEHELFNAKPSGGQKLDNVNLARNVYIRDGNLVIQAVKQNYTGSNGVAYTWTAGHIVTNVGGYDFRKGEKIEFRWKGATKTGMRPATWTSSPASGDDGEFDVPELIMHNQKNTWRVNTLKDYSPVVQHQYDPPGLDANWHTWSCEWANDGLITYTKDGVVIHTCPASYGSGVLNNAHQVRICFQVGGTWGQPIDPTAVKEEMEVDYVRVLSRR